MHLPILWALLSLIQCAVTNSDKADNYDYDVSGQGVTLIPSKPANSTTDWFWYPLDSGEVVPAWLVGGPSPTPFDETENFVTFRLYRNGKTPSVVIKPECMDNCLDTYQRGLPLVVMCHGFGSNGRNLENSYVTNGFANRTDLTFNLILVDWERMATFPWYFTAVRNVEPVGRYIAVLINYLVDREYTTLDLTHYVGHSLGAHVGNYVAKYLKGGKMYRFSGLDPANPLFANRNDSDRIDSSDAQFVDVMHTSTGRNLGANELAVGMRIPRGHIDFYPNGGERQPGCGFNMLGRCSHSRAHELYAESIRNPQSFFGVPCNTHERFDSRTCSFNGAGQYMGWGTQWGSSGIFYLKTKAQSPYGEGNVCPLSS